MCDCVGDSALKPDTVNPDAVLYCELGFHMDSSVVLMFSFSSRHELRFHFITLTLLQTMLLGSYVFLLDT